MAIFGAWTLFGVWLANMYLAGRLATGRPIESWTRPFAIYVAGSWQWALYTPVLVWLAIRLPVERGRRGRAIVVHVAAFFAVMVVDSALDLRVNAFVMSTPLGSFKQQFFGMLQVNLLYYLATFFVTRLIVSQQALRQREVVAAQLETRLANAELQALRAQLHPHFLFNTLNAIASLMRTNVLAAERMVTQLGDLLRITLEQGGAQEVAVADEVAFLERYLAIEQVRFSDRLVTNVEVEPAAYGAAIPHLLLQPLVENAIKHGIAVRNTGGSVSVSVRRVAQVLRCEVTDDGVGLPAGRNGREGVGLSNTRARLHQLYGERHRFEIQPGEAGGVRVLVELPYRPNGGPSSS